MRENNQLKEEKVQLKMDKMTWRSWTHDLKEELERHAIILGRKYQEMD